CARDRGYAMDYW
nr:immunoglobulin heavy chain junction region [Mus musculus]